MAATILVVDDNAATRYATSRVLRSAAFEVLEAANGGSALSLAEQCHPDLIVLDVDLPDIDGFEVCRVLRSTPATARTPVLHLSAVFTRDLDKVQGLDSGADGYMTHPVEPPVLVATINAFLRARRAEDAMRASEAKFTAVFERSPSGVALLSEGMVFLDVNPAACAQLGRTATSVVGQHLGLMLPPASEAILRTATREVDASGAWAGVLPVLAADGRLIHLEWHLSTSLPDTRLAMMTDITHRLEHDAEREALLHSERNARAEAERANRSKDEFLAVLSHELRTPLNAVIGWSHVLRAAVADARPDVVRAVAAIERNAKVQTQLIADLLDVSRIASGKLMLDRESCAAASLVDTAVAALEPLAKERRVRIVREDIGDVSSVYWDQARLAQVVWNLVGNAVKFSPKDTTVHVRLLGQHADHVDLEVSDAGQGISPEFLPHVFDRFRQQDAGITRRHGGLGLGLAVVKHLVEGHGGTVAATSDGDGRGATFRVTLARPRGEQQAARVAQVDADGVLPGARVLVVEDDEDARDIVVRILREAGADVREAGDMASALRVLAEFRAELLISDVGMTGGDGYELMRQVRTSGLSADVLPAIAVTAFGGDSDRARSTEAGFQRHLVKPVPPDALKEVAAGLLFGRHQR